MDVPLPSLQEVADALAVAGAIGVHFGSERRITDEQKQVACLKDMWGESLTLAQHQRVRDLEGDPEAVRAYLLDVLREEKWLGAGGWIANAEKAGPAGIADLSRLDRMKPRAALLLGLWKPGQKDVRETHMPSYLKGDKAPLWDLYLVDPEAAWARGADDTGAGGK